MLKKFIKEKKHRLTKECYIGTNRINFTLCIKNRENIFTNEAIVEKFTQELINAKNKHNCKILVYVFMPDHLHLLAEGKEGKSDLRKMITFFKQKTGYWLSQNLPKIEWQKDFYDHIHRKDEDLDKHIRYILDNPVRKKLCENWKDFSFKGSLEFNLETIFE